MDRSSQAPATLAAQNNAVWCDTMCRAHGAPGEFHDGIWLNRSATPPYYPNAVTLTGEQQAAEQLRRVREIDAALTGEYAVKDSFCALDLAPLGFRCLFEASWIFHSAPLASTAQDSDIVRWTRLRTEQELLAWEVAWHGLPGSALPEGQSPLFPASLLADLEVAMLAVYHQDKIVSGAIANRSSGAVGLSNIFTPERDDHAYWAAFIDAALSIYPGLPLVGYEQGGDLALAQSVGFQAVGPLRVWIKETDAA